MTPQQISILSACNAAASYVAKNPNDARWEGKQFGPQTALALLLGIRQQVVSAWLKRGFVPHKRAVQIEGFTGIPARDLVDPAIVKLFQ